MVKCCYSIGRIDKKLAKFLILFLINEIGSIFYFKYLSDKENVNYFVDFLLRTIGEILGGLLIPCIIKYKKHYSEQIKIKQVIANIPTYFAEYNIVRTRIDISSEDGIITGEDIVKVLDESIMNKKTSFKKY